VLYGIDFLTEGTFPNLEHFRHIISDVFCSTEIHVESASNARGVFAIKASGCVYERFFFARRFWSPQVVKGGAVFRMAKSKRQPQERLPLFFLTAARTEYGLSMVGANGLHPNCDCDLCLPLSGSFILPLTGTPPMLPR
jgi:hypothetical protein